MCSVIIWRRACRPCRQRGRNESVRGAPVLAVRHAQKRFGAVHALKDVSLEAHRGEVLALLGDNGAAVDLGEMRQRRLRTR